MRFFLVACVVAGLAAPAAADGFYFTESFGGTRVSDELSAHMTSAFRLRVAVGLRHGRWAVEGWGGGHLTGGGYLEERSVHRNDSIGGYGLDLKYLQPVSRHVELYLRGGASRAIASGTDLDGYAGRGLGLGAGAQLKGKVRALGFLAWPMFFVPVGPKVTAALWVDGGADFYRLRRGEGGPSIDGKLTTLTVGFAVGSDF